ncbi:transposase [Streptomyces sp. NPDC014656]|uniref:transposase n=1 Tax=Streptomyces sp. NPDC014656 TaxID=3364878 RepID=UPI0036F53C14
MTDAEWAVVRTVLPVPAWMDGRGGRPESHCHRQMVDAVRYLVDKGSSGGRCRRTSRPGTGSTRSSEAGATTL